MVWGVKYWNEEKPMKHAILWKLDQPQNIEGFSNSHLLMFQVSIKEIIKWQIEEKIMQTLHMKRNQMTTKSPQYSRTFSNILHLFCWGEKQIYGYPIFTKTPIWHFSLYCIKLHKNQIQWHLQHWTTTKKKKKKYHTSKGRSKTTCS